MFKKMRCFLVILALIIIFMPVITAPVSADDTEDNTTESVIETDGVTLPGELEEPSPIGTAVMCICVAAIIIAVTVAIIKTNPDKKGSEPRDE